MQGYPLSTKKRRITKSFFFLSCVNFTFFFFLATQYFFIFFIYLFFALQYCIGFAILDL